MAAIARAHGIGLVAGLSLRDGADVYNAALFTDGTREVIHHKIALYGDYERGLFRAGPGDAVIFDHDGITFGLLVCFDVEFPENPRRLARAGAEAILVPTALPQNPDSRFVAQHMVPTRAFENHVFVAYADLCGHDGRFGYAGLSCVAAPDGAILACAGPWGDALLICEIAPQRHARGAGDYNYLSESAQLPP
ncbi:MAG: hydrolase [Rhodobacteraceae bacterium]|nr:hydrolase [Paracoccaceae bacterium]